MKRRLDVEAAVAEALRCTRHIPERNIRAMYIVTQLRLDGYVLQPTRRGPDGRFAAKP